MPSYVKGDRSSYRATIPLSTRLVYMWYNAPGDQHHILLPILPILNRTPLKVPSTSMHQNRNEERRVEVRYDRSAADAQTPREALYPVGGVVRFTSIGPPTTR